VDYAIFTNSPLQVPSSSAVGQQAVAIPQYFLAIRILFAHCSKLKSQITIR
jgi:hypothetical protein